MCDVVIIDILPDDVFLDIFEYFVDRRRSVISEPGEAELLTTHYSGMCAARCFQRSVANAKLPEVNKIKLLTSGISPTDRKFESRDVAIAII